MSDIREQIERSRACAKRVRISKFPDYHAAMWLERNADAMEKLLNEVSSAWQAGYREGFQDWGTEIVSNEELNRKMDIAREFPMHK